MFRFIPRFFSKWLSFSGEHVSWRARLASFFLVRLWNRECEDFRIILEQSGQLHYFYVHAQTQVRLIRAGIVASILFCVFVISFGVLWWQNSQLEASHQQVFRALLASTQEGKSETDIPNLSVDQMIMLADSIRERDALLKDYIAQTEDLVVEANKDLSKELLSTGLSQKRLSMPTEASGGLSNLTSESASLILNQQMLLELEKNRKLKKVFASLPRALPMSRGVPTSGYGIRIHPITNKPHFHTGVDFKPTDNLLVKSTQAGRVVFSGYYGNYGMTVVVDHGNGIRTLYAHLSELRVKVNESIELAQVLGVVGSTGLSTGVHLHYEILVDNEPINPSKVMASGGQSYVRNER